MTKKKTGPTSQKSFKGRPGMAAAESGVPLLEEEVMNVPVVEENCSTPQQVHQLGGGENYLGLGRWLSG